MEKIETKSVYRAKNFTQDSPQSLRDRLLNPWPAINLRSVILIAFVILVYIWGLKGTNADPAELVDGIPNIINFVVRLFPPQYILSTHTIEIPDILKSILGAEFALPLPEIVFAIFETIQMAIIGTTVAVFLSLPFGLLAARNTAPHPFIYQGTRMILNIVRAVPEIIFALIFVSAVGLGPFGGVLALSVGSIGFLGKLYAEAIEAIDPQQVLAIRATGSNPLVAFRYGVIPQAFPLIASSSFYLFEHNVRSATILGLVGAGGVGFVLSKYLALFQYKHLLGALILIIVTVTVVDRSSDWLRKKFT